MAKRRVAFASWSMTTARKFEENLHEPVDDNGREVRVSVSQTGQ